MEQLGQFPLPVEVIPYGAQQLMRIFDEKGYQPVLRQTETGQIAKQTVVITLLTYI